ncbi:hypothetical protein LR48_Vigan252s005900 [Vigna angularis]|uniref:Transposase (putative) gypsy type domain-containing protein n=1 Tax=Phaseolus angularis TaxID=3914 RepID=A0A0L9T6Y7_PHAAN|nr:hypothetical protein LR48_Vigan252s005900 [Vigna angularis]
MEEVDFEESRRAIVELLDVDGGRSGAELHATHSAKVRLSWLRDIYTEHFRRCQLGFDQADDRLFDFVIGWIRIGDMLCRHFSELILRQFEFQQSIPREPPIFANVDILATDDASLQYQHNVIRGVFAARFPSDCVDGYLSWYKMISHPYIILMTNCRILHYSCVNLFYCSYIKIIILLRVNKIFAGSSILGSAGSDDREVEETNIVLEIDTSREWTDSAPPPPVNGYGWAPHEVGLYAPYYVTSASLEYLANRVSIVSTARDAGSILLTMCRSNERACHGQEGHNTDIFYVYSTLFRDMGIRLPFTDFQSSVLRALNVAPTQLHPNRWSYIQAFVVVCTALALTPRSTAFLHFFRAIPQAKSSMTPKELEIVGILDQLSRKTSSRALIELLDSPTLCSRVFDIFGEMEKNKAFLLMMSRKEAELKKTGVGTSSRPGRSLAIPDRPDTSKPPRTVNPTFKITPYSSPSTTPSVVQVNDEASQARPFDSTVHLADRLEYRLNPEEKKLFHRMTTGEAVDLAYELNVRANLCLAYAAGSAKSILAEELESTRLDSAKAQKSNEDLTRRIEKLQKMAEEERQKASATLTQARSTARQLQKVNEELKSDLEKGATQITDLTKERDAFAAAQIKLTAENKVVGDEVCNERFRGFEQGIAQCSYFFQVPLDFPDFDIMKDVVDGKLVVISLKNAKGTPPNENVLPPPNENTP